MKNNDEEPKGPANRGSNTAAAKASTKPELQRDCHDISPTNSLEIVTCYHADEIPLKNLAFHIKNKKTLGLV